MSLAQRWRHWFTGGFLSRSHRRARPSRPGARCRLAVQGLEDRRLLSIVPMGSEFQVNTFANQDQANASVAMDADGDAVVVWQSEGQDYSGAGIVAQRYNGAGVPQGGEFLVNTTTDNSQTFPSVAMDADGDFVIAWQSYTEFGSNSEIFAQAYNAAGVPQGSQFQVNTVTTGYQNFPSVAMNADGDFIITWQSEAQDGSGRGVYAQRYDAAGAPQGGAFQVNTLTDGDQMLPSAAMDDDGDFVITWMSDGQDGSGTGIYAQAYSVAGTPLGGEFQVNTFTDNNQTSPSVAMDAGGEYVITWDSAGQDGGGVGVYAQRFLSPAVPQDSEFRINTFTNNDQAFANVAMDSDGDFVITWQSDGQDGGGLGIYAQAFSPAGVPQGGELRVNTTTLANQGQPSVAMDADGDVVVAWESADQDGSGAGIFAQWYTNDTGGPDTNDQISEAAAAQVGASLHGAIWPATDVDMYAVTVASPQTLAFDLDASVDPAGLDSRIRLFDAAGTQLASNDNARGPNPELDLLESYLTFTFPAAGTYYVGVSSADNTAYDPILGTGDSAGVSTGRYSLTITPFAPGGPAGPEFRVNTITAGNQTSASIGMDADGDFIVAWQSDDGDGAGIIAQMYDALGAPRGGQIQVNTTTANDQSTPSVAVDADGDFVIAWQSYAQDGINYGIYAQRFSALGVPQGGEFLVNTFTADWQIEPSLAMDDAGDFVIAWQSFYQDGEGYGIYAQRYNPAGQPQGSEFRVNTVTTDFQLHPSVAMDSSGDFVIAWQSYLQDASGYGVFAQRYNAAGQPQGSEFRVNTLTAGDQTLPSVAMDADGDFVVAWQSFDANTGISEIHAQAYFAAGDPRGIEFRVNPYLSPDQTSASVAMDADGDFVITWNSLQDGSGYGIQAQRYNAAGVPQGAEFRANTFTSANQRFPGVAMDDGGKFVIAWQSNGQDGDGEGVYAQRFTEGAKLLIDDGEPEFFTGGNWGTGNGPGIGRNNDVKVAYGQPGSADTAGWSFNVVTPGQYRISATWFVNLSFSYLFANSAPFFVSDTGVARGAAIINQQQEPNDFNADGSAWEDLGVFDITGPSLLVQLTNAGASGYVVADAIRIERVGDLPPTAEVQVTEAGFDVPDGAGNVSFGSVQFNTSLVKTFTISNSGTQPVTLTLPVTVTPGSGFTVLTQPNLTTLDAGEFTTFTVRMDGAVPGSKVGTISFGNNDSNENPFNFTVSGTVLATQIVDDRDAGYTNQNVWGALAGYGYRDLYHYSRYFTDADISTWTFSVTPGQYRVSATWFTGATFFDSTAPFTVFDGAASRGGRDLNQQNLPDDRVVDGASWEDVGVFNILGNTMSVQLKGDDLVNFVVADAILIERLGAVPAGPEIAVLDGTHDVNAGPPVSFGTTEGNHPVDKIFTITNSGTTALNITGPITVPLGYQLQSGPGLTTLNPNQTTTFTVRLTAEFDGIKAGQITIPTNDANENPLTFNVTGTVLATQILDDGQPGFASTGDFQSASVASARDGDVRYVFFQAAPSEATWTFTVTPGQYTVAATWFDTGGNGAFASVAPFSVLDGAALEGTFNLNQRNAPDDFLADDDFWENIGGQFDITSTTLTVRLTNVGADGYVLADAIRLFRVGPPGNAESGTNQSAASSSLSLSDAPTADPVRPEPTPTDALDAAFATVFLPDDVDDLAVEPAADSDNNESSDQLDELPASNPTTDPEALDLALADWE